jgi:FlaA1/EpsC-like NDP-sugar epimerase
LVSDIATFADKYRRKVKTWRHKLEQMAQEGRRVVVWGGGSKGVSFLNTLKTRGRIEYVVDINPRKQGRYVAGTGQQIVPPDFLGHYQPDIIIVMNPVYQREIQEIMEGLGFIGNVETV